MWFFDLITIRVILVSDHDLIPAEIYTCIYKHTYDFVDDPLSLVNLFI